MISKIKERKVFKAAYSSVFNNLNILLRASAIWIVIIAISDIAYTLLENSTLNPILAFCAIVTYAIGMVTFSVVWFRFILLDERPKDIFIFPTKLRYLRFFGMAILVEGISVTPALVLLIIIWIASNVGVFEISPLSGHATSLYMIAQFIPLFLIASAIFLSMRFQFTLAAAATEDKRVTIARSWELMRGNTWRAIGAVFVCLIPFGLASSLLELVVADVDKNYEALILFMATLISTVLIFLSVAIAIAVVSCLYKSFLDYPNS